MRARGGAAGLESGVWYGRYKPAMDRTTYNASYYGGSKIWREREREWGLATICSSNGKKHQNGTTEHQWMSRCVPRGGKNKTEQNKIKHSQND